MIDRKCTQCKNKANIQFNSINVHWCMEVHFDRDENTDGHNQNAESNFSPRDYSGKSINQDVLTIINMFDVSGT
jgi:hypothetical protein